MFFFNFNISVFRRPSIGAADRTERPRGSPLHLQIYRSFTADRILDCTHPNSTFQTGHSTTCPQHVPVPNPTRDPNQPGVGRFENVHTVKTTLPMAKCDDLDQLRQIPITPAPALPKVVLVSTAALRTTTTRKPIQISLQVVL